MKETQTIVGAASCAKGDAMAQRKVLWRGDRGAATERRFVGATRQVDVCGGDFGAAVESQIPSHGGDGRMGMDETALGLEVVCGR